MTNAPERIWHDARDGFVRIPTEYIRADIAAKLEADNTRLREALEPFASISDLIDIVDEGIYDSDELELVFPDDLTVSWRVSLFRNAKRALGGK